MLVQLYVKIKYTNDSFAKFENGEHWISMKIKKIKYTKKYKKNSKTEISLDSFSFQNEVGWWSETFIEPRHRTIKSKSIIEA